MRRLLVLVLLAGCGPGRLVQHGRVNEDALPWLHLRCVDQGLPRREPGQRERGGLGVIERGRLACELTRRRRDLLSIVALAQQPTSSRAHFRPEVRQMPAQTPTWQVARSGIQTSRLAG